MYTRYADDLKEESAAEDIASQDIYPGYDDAATKVNTMRSRAPIASMALFTLSNKPVIGYSISL